MTVKLTSFIPACHGFHFANSFIDKTFVFQFPSINLNIPGIPSFPGGSVTKIIGGRCAGMSFAALDYYWNQNVIPVIPTHTGSDFGPGNSVPDLGNGFGKYINDRHTAANSPDPPCDANMARILLLPRADYHPILGNPVIKGSFNFTLDQLRDDIKLQLISGNPVPIALVADQTIDSISGGNHCVVAYGYDDGNDDLYVYDCNHPDRECYIRPNGSNNSFETFSHEASGWTKVDTWKGYYRKNYSPVTPTYFDLSIKVGLQCKDDANNIVTSVFNGGSLTVEYKIVNNGQYTARLRHYYLSVTKVNNQNDINGTNEDGRLGIVDTDTNLNNEITLPAGQDFLVSKRSTPFTTNGWYRIGSSFKTVKGFWAGFHPQSGQSSDIWINVFQITYTWLAAAMTPDGRIEIFGRGSDNGIYHKFQQPGGGWHAPESLTGILIDNCMTAANFSDNRLLVVHRGTTKQLYYRILASTGWDGGWNSLGGDLSDCPMIIRMPKGKLRILALFNNGSTQYRDETSGGWKNWVSV